MPPLTRRRALIASLLAAGVAVVATGCIIMPPPLPTAQPIPLPTAAEPEPSQEPAESSESGAAGELPEVLELNMPLAAGTLAGWETSIIADSDFTLEADNDFPQGPTISVRETATACTFWAYQGAQDGDSADERENTELTLASTTGTDAADWEADELALEPSASQGVSVVFLTIYQEDDVTGDVEAWFSRNFQSSQTTSTIRANCPGGAGGIEHIDEVVAEHFQINFLLP